MQGRRQGEACRRRAGFTMLEVMVAIGVLIVATLSAFSSQLTSMRLVSTSRQTDIAIGDLRACMEQVLVLPTDEIPVAGSAYQDGQRVQAYNDLHLPGQQIVPSYPGYDGGVVPDPLPIVLTMTWNDDTGRPRTQVLRSMKAR